MQQAAPSYEYSYSYENVTGVLVRIHQCGIIRQSNLLIQLGLTIMTIMIKKLPAFPYGGEKGGGAGVLLGILGPTFILFKILNTKVIDGFF